jgi:hypothetical protein
MTVSEVWDASQLMGGGATTTSSEQANGGGSGGGQHPHHTPAPAAGKGNPLLWGVPGHLTKEEADVYFKFKDTVEKRGGEFRETVYSFGEEEGEVWALCRWLRARKFVYDDCVKMIEEATQVRKEAKSKEFYPNPVDALGVDPSVFFAQYPQLYNGVTKLGVPVFISKPGILNVDGIECITTLDGIIKFHWHVMMHDFANRLLSRKAASPDEFKRYAFCEEGGRFDAESWKEIGAFVNLFSSAHFLLPSSSSFALLRCCDGDDDRFECFCILDLGGLTTAQLSSRSLAIVKEQAAIDSVCFPETMHKMIIVNAPTFFSATWRLIRGWLDPRTANKIEVISSKAAYAKRLLELIDPDQLPSDYGGTGTDTNKILQNSMQGDAERLDTRMMYIRCVFTFFFACLLACLRCSARGVAAAENQ